MKNFNLKLFNKGDSVIIALSGGTDSVVLLHLLFTLRHRLGIRLQVAHYDHRVRVDSGDDAVFAKHLAAHYGLPFYLGKRRGRGKLSEEQARQLRVTFLTGLAHQIKAHAIVTAHHQNDLAETVLMRIIRGSGLVGLRGIVPVSYWDDVKVVRPLLNISRGEIEVYSKKHRLEFRTDSTNYSTEFLRNKVRLKLLPLLEKDYNNQVIDALANLADVACVDYDFLLNLATQEFYKCAKVKPKTIILNRTGLMKLHPALIRLVIRISLEKLTNHLKQFNHAHYCSIMDLMMINDKKNLVLPYGVKAVLTAKALNLSI